MPSPRDFLLRLTPDRALDTLDDAEEFLRERGMLTLMPSCSLPSLFGACHEEPYRPGSPGFGSWPRTKYVWPFELQRRGTLSLKILRGTGLLVSDDVAPLVDPLARAALAAAEGDEARLLEHVAQAGPSLLDDVKEELNWDARTLRAVRARLERTAALVARDAIVELPDGGHRHASELYRWDQIRPEPSGRGGLDDLVVAAVRAAVEAPEREVRGWFTWKVDAERIERLVADGRLAREDTCLTAS